MKTLSVLFMLLFLSFFASSAMAQTSVPTNNTPATYRITAGQRSDVGWRIAERFLGDGKKVTELMAINPELTGKTPGGKPRVFTRGNQVIWKLFGDDILRLNAPSVQKTASAHVVSMTGTQWYVVYTTHGNKVWFAISLSATHYCVAYHGTTTTCGPCVRWIYLPRATAFATRYSVSKYSSHKAAFSCCVVHRFTAVMSASTVAEIQPDQGVGADTDMDLWPLMAWNNPADNGDSKRIAASNVAQLIPQLSIHRQGFVYEVQVIDSS